MSDYPDADAFPNAPGLSKALGLTRADKTPPAFKGEGADRMWWASICSAHREPADGCRLCRVGCYVPCNKSGERT